MRGSYFNISVLSVQTKNVAVDEGGFQKMSIGSKMAKTLILIWVLPKISQKVENISLLNSIIVDYVFNNS